MEALKSVFESKDSKQAIPTSPQGLMTVNHFGVSVRDVQRSIAFYSALTGQEPSGQGVWSSEGLGKAVGVEGGATITWAAFRLGNINIDLLQVDKPTTAQASYEIGQKGAMHICFEVTDLPAVFARMEAAGIAFLGPNHRITAAGDGAQQGAGTEVAYFVGPDGEFLELIAPAGPFVRAENAGR